MTRAKEIDRATSRLGPVTYSSVLKIWLPLGLTQFLVMAEDPIYVAVLMRLQYPELELGALFSYAWPILLLIGSAVFILNTVGNVFATNLKNVRRLERLAAGFGLSLTLVLVAIAFSPLSTLIFRDVMAVPKSELDMSVAALQIFSLYPAVKGLNQLYQGILIRGGRTIEILVSRCIRFAIGMVVLLVGLKTEWLAGAVLGASAWVGALIVQTVYLFIRCQPIIHHLRDHPIDEDVVGLRNLVRFTIPLSITPILTGISALVMSAAIGRLPGVIVSLAVWPVITNFSSIGTAIGASYNQVTVKLAETSADRSRLLKFALVLGFLLTAVNALFIVSGLFFYALRTMEKLDLETARISLNAMWFLMPLPFIYTMNAYYSGLLAKAKKTMPILESQMASLLIVTMVVLATVNLEPFRGVYVVSAVSVAANLVACLWVWSAWRKYAACASRDELGKVDAAASIPVHSH